MTFDLISVANKVAPSVKEVQKEIFEFKKSNKYSNKDKLADLFISRITKKYTSTGVASALPGAIPGIGTAAQVFAEVGSVSGDLLLMLRWMANLCMGLAIIYEKDITQDYNKEFIMILGKWCGVIEVTKTAVRRVSTKVATVQFNKHISGKVLSKINQRVGTTIVTKYGTKRGGVALGRLIPFGVGAAIGGSFNYMTMKGFGARAKEHYRNEYFDECIIL